MNLACRVLCLIRYMVTSMATEPPATDTSSSARSRMRREPDLEARLSYAVKPMAKKLMTTR